MYVATLRAIQVGIFCFQITLHVHVVSLRVLMRHVSVSGGNPRILSTKDIMLDSLRHF